MTAWNIYKYEIRNESLRPFAGSRGILSLFEPTRGPPTHLTHSKMTNLKQDGEMSFLKNNFLYFGQTFPIWHRCPCRSPKVLFNLQLFLKTTLAQTSSSDLSHKIIYLPKSRNIFLSRHFQMRMVESQIKGGKADDRKPELSHHLKKSTKT